MAKKMFSEFPAKNNYGSTIKSYYDHGYIYSPGFDRIV